MSMNLAYLGLAIDSPSVRSDGQNFRPLTWPPEHDFPVVIDAAGHLVSRYGDPMWDLRPWAKKPVILNFGDGPQKRGFPNITPDNANLLRQVVAWWLYGPTAVHSPITLRQKFYVIRPLFCLCSSHNVIASDLEKFPALTDEFRLSLAPAMAERILALFHVLFEQRDQLGFTLLNREALTLLEASLPKHEVRQTPYIPPRIWAVSSGCKVIQSSD